MEGSYVRRFRSPLPVLRPLHGQAPPGPLPRQVLVGLTDGTARLFLLATGDLVADLECRGEEETVGGTVRGHIGLGLVVAGTSTGWLSVWHQEGLGWARQEEAKLCF